MNQNTTLQNPVVLYRIGGVSSAVLSPDRLSELHARVRRGYIILARSWTSAWVTEALKPDFTMSYFLHRADVVTEPPMPFFAAMAFIDRHAVKAGIPEGRDRYVHFGLDIEEGCPYQELHYRGLTDLWKGFARLFLDKFKE